MGTGGIYEIVNAVNGKRYIGSAVNLARRWTEHRRLLRKGKHHSAILQHAWNKHGEAAFQFLPVMTVEDKQDIVLWEQRFLIALKPEYNIALNATAPMLGRKHSPEDLKKMSESMRGKNCGPHSTEHCANISASLIGNKYAVGSTGRVGKKHSPKTKDKMSISGLRSWAVDRATGGSRLEALKGNTNTLGYKHTPESSAKMSEAQRGNTKALGLKRSPETLVRMSKSQKGRIKGPQSAELIEKRIAPLRGRKQSPEHIAKVTKAARLRASYVRLMQFAWAGA